MKPISLQSIRSNERSGIYIVLLILVGAAFVVNVLLGVNFFRLSNLLNIARSFSMLGLAALGQTIVIISGGLDLSVGEAVSTSNVIAANFMVGDDARLFAGIVIVCLFGALVGLLNGLLVSKRNVPPFIATLGMATVVKGIRLIWTKGLPTGSIPESLKTLGTGTSLGIPNLLYVFVVGALVISFLLTRTGFGRRIYVTGTNRNVAVLSGIRADRVTIMAYVTCSVCAALVGVLIGGYTGMADQFSGDGYDIDTIAASVLGGAAIGGGIGSVSGTVIGTIIMLIVTNLSVLAHFPIQSQMLMKGILIIIALWLNGKKA